MSFKFKDDLTGQQFTRWTALRRGDKPKHWLCRCVCGAMREVLAQNLRNGYSRSCGCLPKGHAPSRREVQQHHIDSVVQLISHDDRRDIQAAFRVAQAAGHSVPECYLAAVRVVQVHHPECSREYAGKRAVEIILESRMKVLTGETSPRSKDEENRP